MKKTFAILASLVILGSSAVSQAVTGPVYVAGIAPDYSVGAGATSTGAPVMDSQGQPVSTSVDTQRLNSAAYLLLEQENKPHCRIASKFQTTGNVSHGYWFGSDSKKRLEDEVVFLSQNSDQAKHWLECE